MRHVGCRCCGGLIQPVFRQPYRRVSRQRIKVYNTHRCIVASLSLRVGASKPYWCRR